MFDAVLCMTDTDWVQLIPKAGPRCLFKQKFRKVFTNLHLVTLVTLTDFVRDKLCARYHARFVGRSMFI
jgi:hypothetical protein